MFVRLLLATTAISLAANAAHAQEAKKWQPTIELEGRTNDDRSIAYPKMLIPLAQDSDSMLFTDIRGRLDDQSSQEYNLGLGYRQMRGGWIYGGYVFADHLHSANGFDYWQGTAGLEMLTEDWDIRVNGYLPESSENSLGGAPSIVIDGGGNFGISTTNFAERAMPGVDAEVGYRLPIDAVDLRAFGGVYHFAANGFEDVTGPKARVELTMKHEHWDTIPDGVEFTVGAQFQNDGPREDTTSALAQLRIPFGSGAKQSQLTRLERRMTNFIERDVDIVAGTGSAKPTFEAAEIEHFTGNNYTRIDAVVDANTADINATLNTAGVNGVILFDSAAGDILLQQDSMITPLDGQTLIGSGAAVIAHGLTSGTTIFSYLPGSTPTVSNNVPITGGALLDINGVSATLDGINFRADDSVDSGIRIRNQGINHLAGIMFSEISNTNMHGVEVVDSDGIQYIAGIHAENTPTGFLIDNSAHTVLQYVSADTVYRGMEITDSSQIIVMGISASSLVTGIEVNNSDEIAIYDFELESDVAGTGIALFDTDDVTIEYGIINTKNAALGDVGIYIDNATNTEILDTSISGHTYGFYADNAQSLWVENAELNHNRIGIHLGNSDDISFYDTSIHNAAVRGLLVSSSTNLDGELTMTDTPTPCSLFGGPNTGSILINGTTTCP